MEKYIPKFFDMLYDESVASLISLQEIRDAFHSNQIHSKHQAVNALSHLPNHTGKLLYIGSWIGFLTHYICKEYPNFMVDEIDIDTRVEHVSRYFNSKFYNYGTHYATDVLHFEEIHNYNTVVNLSSEHMPSDWFEKVKPGTQCVIQSNNLNIEDHINLCYSIEELKQKFPLSSICYENTMKLNVFTRYTISGIK